MKYTKYLFSKCNFVLPINLAESKFRGDEDPCLKTKSERRKPLRDRSMRYIKYGSLLISNVTVFKRMR